MNMITTKLQIKSVEFCDKSSSIFCSTNMGFAEYSILSGIKRKGYNTRLDPNFLGGIRLCASYPGSNVIAVVSDKEDAKIVYIIDIDLESVITSITVQDEITYVQLKRDYIIISTTKKIYAKRLIDFSQEIVFATSFSHFKSFDSPPDPECTIIAFCDECMGVISIADITDGKIINSFHAFKTQICSIKFSPSGKKLALVSDAGRKVKVYEFPRFKLIASLYRGMSESNILSLSFNIAETCLSLSSTSGTVHVFDLFSEKSEDPSETTRAAIKLATSNDKMSVSFCLRTGNLIGVTLNGKLIEWNMQDPTKPQMNIISDQLSLP